VRNALVLALSALVIFVAASSWLVLYPGVPEDAGGVASTDASAEHVKIPVGEDDHLDGWLLRGTRPGIIVLMPGYARDHRRMWRYEHFLRADGWSLLALDFRSARTWKRKPTTLGFYELADGRATLDWIAKQPRFAREPIGLFGESLGGSVALSLAAERPDIRAIAVDSPFANGRMAIEDGCRYVAHLPVRPFAAIQRWLGTRVSGHDPAQLDAVAAVRALGERPLLLIQSGLEDRFSRKEVEMLTQAAGPGAQTWRVEDSGHNRAWLEHRSEYERRVRTFFARYLSVRPQHAARAAVAPATNRRHARVAA
jgi:fermentation-respiration switch protein FrsA (DUF1100 family)